MFKQKKAFTLIELLVVIAIIGILATLAVVALQQARQNARDSKRMADVKQIHTALELFYNENSRYPTTEEFQSGSPLVSSSTGEVFIHQIPSAPTPADGDCQPASNTYIYTQLSEGASYTIDFCTGKQVSDLPQGAKQMTPGGIAIAGGSGGEETPAWVCGDDFTDTRDGNIYPTVQIGVQCWFAKNLAYLPAVHSNTEFSAQGTNSLPGYGVWGYNGSIVADAKEYMHTAGNTFNMYQTYGVLYNWFAVNQTVENAICPPGWSVPSDEEWTILTDYIIAETDATELTPARWLKSCRQVSNEYTEECLSPLEGEGTNTSDHPRWNAYSTSYGINAYGFNALPAGSRTASGFFGSFGSDAFFWSSTLYDTTYAWRRLLGSSYSSVARSYIQSANGYSVRCLRTE